MSQIMKKAILTFGLFSMMLVLTSFTSNEIGGVKPPVGEFKYEIGGVKPPVGDYTLEIGGVKPPVGDYTFEIGGVKPPVGE